MLAVVSGNRPGCFRVRLYIYRRFRREASRLSIKRNTNAYRFLVERGHDSPEVAKAEFIGAIAGWPRWSVSDFHRTVNQSVRVVL